MANKQKYIGRSKMEDAPDKPFQFVLSEQALNKIAVEARYELTPDLNSLQKYVDSKLTDMQNQIDSFDEHGIAVSNEFGNDPHIGISQKTLTEVINAIWSKLSDITGETMQGISMVVNPSYYIGEDGCTVRITPSSIDEECMFEEIWFYWNNSEEPFAGSAKPTNHFEFDTEISETTSIKCRAKILGVWYEDIKLITHFSSYWLGFGADYQAVQTRKPISPVPPYMRGAYDLTANNGDHLFVILGEKFASGFIRADLNGMEIAMTKDTTTLPGYVIFTSENTYQAGTYNIDING